MADAVNINDLLDGHVGLDVECLDRIYLNVYVPNLQVGGQAEGLEGRGGEAATKAGEQVDQRGR
jgi:hypothetical protein